MRDLESFKAVIQREFLSHPVVVSNPYTAWFAQGEADTDQMMDLINQFSVFSNHFLVLQVKRMVNASTIEGERCARNILMNECGVALDPRSGLVEGKSFSTANAHLNWLREIGAILGLSPMELGRWEKGSRSTRAFLDGLDRTYGNRDGQIGAGASFAIENWAAFGIGQGPELEARNFWKQLIAGVEAFNARRRVPLGLKPLPLGFFKFHFEIESGHGLNVWKELEETFDDPEFDQVKFLRGGQRALQAIKTFWLGLDRSRRRPVPFRDIEETSREADCLAGINVA